MWTAFGIFLGFCANLAVKDVDPFAWKLQIGPVFISAIPFTPLFLPCVFLLVHQEASLQCAMNSLLRLHNSRLHAARDLFYIHAQLEEEEAIVGATTFLRSVYE